MLSLSAPLLYPRHVLKPWAGLTCLTAWKTTGQFLVLTQLYVTIGWVFGLICHVKTPLLAHELSCRGLRYRKNNTNHPLFGRPAS